MSRKFAVGVTLTAEEKARIGFDSRPARNRLYTESPPATPSNIVRSWTCEVTLPDGTACSVSYQRDGPRCHRFSFQEPLKERLWHMEALEGGAYAIEQKAQELAAAAFAQAQAAEQQEMRRATAPGGYREQPTSRGHGAAADEDGEAAGRAVRRVPAFCKRQPHAGGLRLCPSRRRPGRVRERPAQ